jgi:hypothetical protein
MKSKLLLKAAIHFLFVHSLFFVYAQKEINPNYKIAYVILENRYTNFILIPNQGKFHSFKIYRKLKADTSFVFLEEKYKPILPIKNEVGTPYGVSWEDPKFHSREVDYKVIAFDKKGNQLCEMQMIWEKEIKSTKSDSLKVD